MTAPTTIDPAQLAEGVPAPLVIIGDDDRLTVANAAARALLGGDILGRHRLMVLRHPGVEDAIATLRRTGGPVEFRLQRVRLTPGDDGGERWFHAVLWAVGGRAMALCLTDMTEMEQAGQMRRDFVANVSHELRTPLTSLMGFIETLQGPARDDAPARDRFLAIMAHEAQRMNRLVRDLLGLSRVEAQEAVRPVDRVDLGVLIAAAAAAMRPTADAAGIVIEVESLTDAPPTVLGDADQITQLVTNLLENAVKYGGAGGTVTVRIASDVLPQGPAARIDVIDRGEGIDPVHLPRLTERFYRVDSHRSRAMGGTGLGLAIVKHVVQRHRGRLRIESEPGKGSVFSVLLPKASQD